MRDAVCSKLWFTSEAQGMQRQRAGNAALHMLGAVPGRLGYRDQEGVSRLQKRHSLSY
jgi:hypothetical protein